MGEAAKIDIEAWRRDFDGLDERDWERVQRLFAEDVEWVEPPEVPDATVHHGKDAVVRFWEGILDAADEWSVRPQEFIRGGDDVLVRSRMKMTARHTGLALDTEFWQVFTFSEGRIVRQRGFFDREPALEAFDGELDETPAA